MTKITATKKRQQETRQYNKKALRIRQGGNQTIGGNKNKLVLSQ